jgi:thiamine biosynthesis protein ThiS
MTGLEPANAGTTTQCRDHLATSTTINIIHKLSKVKQKQMNVLRRFRFTYWLRPRNSKIIINANPFYINKPVTLSNLLKFLKCKTTGIAIDYNGQLLKQVNWQDTELKNKDVIEIVTIVGGG